MNPVVKAQLSEFSKSNLLDANYKDYEVFEVFAVFSVCNGLLTNNLDPLQIHLKGDEFGIDAFAILVNGELCQTSDDVEAAFSHGKSHDVEFLVLQAKTSESMDYGEMSKFFDATLAFLDNKFPQPTDAILELQSAKDTVYTKPLKQNPALKMFFVNTGNGKVQGAQEQLIATSKKRLEEMNIFSSISIEVIGAKELQDSYRSATSSITGKIDIPNNTTLPAHPAVQEAFLGFVTAKQLVALVSDNSADAEIPRLNRGIFFDNVRDYDDASEINLSIIDQLKNGDSASFVFKNNGITVVAKDIKRVGNTFTLEDFQIVNGCQTTNILFKCRDHLEGVVVPFRLIGSNNPEFVSTIIIGTNKQNEVREDQFWSLLPFMKSLEEYCREQPEGSRIYLERRENQYRDATIERRRICKPRDLLKAIAAIYLYRPHRAARDYRGVSKEFSKDIFQPKHSVVPYHAAAFAAYKIDTVVRFGKIDKGLSIYKYYVLSAIGFKWSDGRDIFSLKPKEQEKVGSAIIELVSDENAIAQLFEEVSKSVGEWVADLKTIDREKLRDTIRTETFFAKFKASFLKS
jgi:AIPR protein